MPYRPTNAQSDGEGRRDRITVMAVSLGQIFDSGLALILNNAQEIRLAGPPVGIERLETEIEDLRPDAVVLYASHLEDGRTAIARMRARRPDMGIVALCHDLGPARAVRLSRLGASICIPQDARRADVIEAIRAAARGERRLVSSGNGPAERSGRAESPAGQIGQSLLDRLTRRELDVYELLCAGLTDVEIATLLNVSANTVHTHGTHIYRKLEVKGRRQLIA